jgi:hypothetical protein
MTCTNDKLDDPPIFVYIYTNPANRWGEATMTDAEAERILEAGEEQKATVESMIAATKQEKTEFWKRPWCTEHYIRVQDAEIRVFHVKPPNTVTKRPLVFIPGWGVIPEGFAEFYGVIDDRAELYYIETREKGSSRILSKRADMSVSQNAKDIQIALDVMGLSELDDFVLLGTCWGSAGVLQGLIDGTLDAPTIVAVDPMHALWFPKWLLRYVSPILPVASLHLLKPILRHALIGDMKEKTQKQRVDAFIDNADVWKWKKGADAAKDFELYGKLARVNREVFVFNGSFDKIHEQLNYPRIAGELTNGRFIYMPTDESKRERVMALVALEFAKVSKEQGLPPLLAPFEKTIR